MAGVLSPSGFLGNSTAEESTPWHATSLYASQGVAKSRFGATLELLGNEITHNITGRDMVGDTVQGCINGFRTVVQAGLEVGPAIVHTFTGQKFYVTPREGVIDATTAAVGSTFTELGNGKPLTAAYTAVAEVPDGLTRDLLQTDSVMVAADHP